MSNPDTCRPRLRGAKDLMALACAMAIVAGAISFPAPATAQGTGPAPATTTPTPVAKDDLTLEEKIGERGSFMGQSLVAEHLDVPLQEVDQRRLSQARAFAPMAANWKAPGINGLDVSGWQPQVNWNEQRNMGARFAYIKATEGNTFTSDAFNRQYSGAYRAGLIRGAYHFALPARGNAKSQARFFVNNGGGWSADGKTLPPLLDMEMNPYGSKCYSMSANQLVTWIKNFSGTVNSMTGRRPMIYTNYNWWTDCTNNSTALRGHALHAAAYPYAGYEDGFNVFMYGGWKDYTVWQYSSTGPFAGDSNQWNGTYKELQQFATNGFADVTTSDKYYKQIMWADRRGITNGWPDGTFRPLADTNRDAVAAFLYRVAGKPHFNPPQSSPFKDYPRGSKFYKEVTWLEATGITTGWKDGTFRPLADINRDAMAAFLYRYDKNL